MTGGAKATPLYSISDLGALGGNDSAAYSLNDYGQVVGMSKTNSGTWHSFIYSNGVMTDIDMVGNFNPFQSVARSINNLGQVVGTTTIPFAGEQAFLYSQGTMVLLGALNGGRSNAFDINEAGKVVGDSLTYRVYLGPESYHAATFNSGPIQDLGTSTYGQSNAHSSAYGINNLGQIVGSVSDGNYTHAFLYQNNVMSEFAVGSEAVSINDQGQIVVVGGSQSIFSYIYQDGNITYLGGLGGIYTRAANINERGQVVGYASITATTGTAFLFDDTGIHDLNLMIDESLGWDLEEALDINELGQIVGWGWRNGNFHAFLLTEAGSVPEPESLPLLLVSLGIMGWMTRRSKA